MKICSQIATSLMNSHQEELDFKIFVNNTCKSYKPI